MDWSKKKMRTSSGRTAIWAFVLLLMSSYASAQSQIPIVVGAGADDAEKFAAEELATHLQHLYSDQRFPVTTSVPNGLIVLYAFEKHQNRQTQGLNARGKSTEPTPLGTYDAQ
jgi:hypothetical protein